jgi:hypothetical protein
MTLATEEHLMRKSYQKEINNEDMIEITYVDYFIFMIFQKKTDLYYLKCEQNYFSNTLFKDKNIQDIYEIIVNKIKDGKFEIQCDNNCHLTLNMDVENKKINFILFKTFSYLFEQINELNNKLQKKWLIVLLLSLILFLSFCTFLFVLIWKPKNNHEYFNIMNDQYKLVNNF